VVLPRLRKFGFTQAEIDTMTKKNPARFIGLEEW
jgi:predicted metal-dependent phosphotriesterase family hydrolase